MSAVHKIAFIGNSLPRRCGIATFTTDLQMAVQAIDSNVEACIVAMTDGAHQYAYPPSVAFQIREDTPDDYARAANFLNAGGYDCVCLQHEFGIFGGEAGADLLILLARLTMPIITTLHTVLTNPTAAQREVLLTVVARSTKIIVMAQKAKEILEDVYGVEPHRIEVIPHGIPDVAFVQSAAAKKRLGFAGRPVVLTFGLLSPNKGIETIIEAMPSILARSPDAIYVVLGATHPNLVRDEGEAYRNSLVARAQMLGVAKSVRFLDQFVEQHDLLEFISSCDVYVTPYLDAAQMTSGTLAYSFGSGRPVVSTPYWHARELLSDGRGVFVPFGDAAATAQAVGDLLTDDIRRQAMAKRAYAASRAMTWSRTADAYLAAFQINRRAGADAPIAIPGVLGAAARGLPTVQLGHLNLMCDDTGLFQHAVHSVPDRSQGYCVDDNARALLLACALNAPGEQRLSDLMASRFAAFVQHAWNPDNKRFRNFMGFNRTWLESVGSEDSHGRTLWALGECARSDSTAARRRWAAMLFSQALRPVLDMTSPRAWAFTLLGLDAYCEVTPKDGDAERTRTELADRLMECLSAASTNDWHWYEDVLAYDNARLPQALILTGIAIKSDRVIDAGTRSLSWLMTQQLAPAGHFRPVGSSSFGAFRQPPSAFDQQPLEAAATVAACRAAFRLKSDPEWAVAATSAFDWFLGRNDLSASLVDIQSGRCRDGLHPDRANQNCGGESVVSYLLALADMRAMARARPEVSNKSQVRVAGL